MGIAHLLRTAKDRREGDAVSLLRSPLAHFVALGLLLFTGSQLGDDREAAALSLEVPPGLDANQGRAWVEESLLVEAALAHGLHRHDPVVRRRLVANLRFAGVEGDETTLLASAERLDMARHDPVVRRRLATRLLATRKPIPAVDDLAAWYAAHASQFRTPPRRDFSHVWIPDIRRSYPSARLPRRLTRTQARLSAALGERFATDVFTAPVGQWVGPVASPLGQHLVFVHKRHLGAVPPLAAVRRAAIARRRAEQQRHQRDATLAALRAHYGVVDVAEDR